MIKFWTALLSLVWVSNTYAEFDSSVIIKTEEAILNLSNVVTARQLLEQKILATAVSTLTKQGTEILLFIGSVAIDKSLKIPFVNPISLPTIKHALQIDQNCIIIKTEWAF